MYVFRLRLWRGHTHTRATCEIFAEANLYSASVSLRHAWVGEWCSARVVAVTARGKARGAEAWWRSIANSVSTGHVRWQPSGLGIHGPSRWWWLLLWLLQLLWLLWRLLQRLLRRRLRRLLWRLLLLRLLRRLLRLLRLLLLRRLLYRLLRRLLYRLLRHKHRGV